MGGKAKPSNNEMVEFEKQQAQEARDRENQRQGRLTQGKQAIDDLFAGGGFDDAFYDKYKNAELGATLPQMQDQFQKLKDSTTFALARSGLLRSTAAGQATADMESQRINQEAALRSKADQDLAALRSGISGQQQSAYNQLYATEDPDVAATTAMQMVQNIPQTPNVNPLGELFKPLVIGSIGAGTGLVDSYNYNKAGLGTKGPFDNSAYKSGQG